MLTEIVSGATGAAVSGAVTYLFGRAERTEHQVPLKGKPLAQLPTYPVQITGDEKIFLDLDLLQRSCLEIIAQRNERAAVELIYLADRNHEIIDRSPRSAKLIQKVRRRFRKKLRNFTTTESQRDDLLSQFGRITLGLGQNFGGLPIEFVLHDTRDPLHAICEIANPITGREIGSPTSSLVLRYIISHAKYGWANPIVGYLIDLPGRPNLKSTTIPIEDPVLGLVAFLCVNIDIQRLNPDSPELKSLIRILIDTPAGPGKETFFARSGEPGSASMPRSIS